MSKIILTRKKLQGKQSKVWGDYKMQAKNEQEYLYESG